MKYILLFTCILLFASFIAQDDFLSEQKKYERVRTAYQEKDKLINSMLAREKIKRTEFSILIAAYKEEGLLELFAKNKTDQQYKRIASYSICEQSGELGPKRKQGDNQVPEGFYHIDRFNPASFYYLSLGINYPNASDKLKSSAKKLGGDIFIHGSCVTIGCLPMTDEKIKEIYLYAIEAKRNGQAKIPVYIFPFKMNAANMITYKAFYKSNTALLSFWNQLKIGYDQFEKNKKELQIDILSNGDYSVK